MFLNPRFNYAIRFVFTSYSVADINGVPDGKSERSFCSSQSCFENTVDLPFKRAFNPHSRGYDCGNADNWIIGEYTRIHRDIDIINAMRKWLYSTEEKKINNTELYTTDELKAVCDEKC
jgi:alpha-amylase